MSSPSRPLRLLLLATALLSVPAAAAEEVLEQDVSLGAAVAVYTSFLRRSELTSLGELAYTRQAGTTGAWRSVLLSGGIRSGPEPRPGDPLKTPLIEGFLRAQVRARFGIWEVAAGPELGASGFATVVPRPIPADHQDFNEEARISPWYFAFSASPCRLHFGRVVVSLAEFHVGAAAWPVVSAVRFHVGLARVGVTL